MNREFFMFEKIETIIIKNAENVEFSVAKKEEASLFWGNISGKLPKGTKKEKSKYKDQIIYNFKGGTTDSLISFHFPYLKKIVFLDSKVTISGLNSRDTVEEVFVNGTIANFDQLFKHDFKINSVDSTLIMNNYVIENLRLVEYSKSKSYLKRGFILNASIFAKMFSGIEESSSDSYIFNVTDSYFNHFPSFQGNVINDFNTIINDRPRYVNPKRFCNINFIDSYKDGQDYDKVKSSYSCFTKENMDLEYSDLYLLEIIKEKYDSGELRINCIEADVSSAIAWEGIEGNIMPMFLNSIEEDYDKLLKDKLDLKKLDYNKNVELFYTENECIEDKLNNIKAQQDLHTKLHSFKRIENRILELNKEIRNIDRELNGIIELSIVKDISFNFNEHKDIHDNFKKFYFDLITKCHNFRNYLKKEEEKRKEKIKLQNKVVKNEQLILGLLDKEFPTDYINEENREAIIELLNQGFLKNKPLSCLQSKNLKKLNLLFDVKNPVVQF